MSTESPVFFNNAAHKTIHPNHCELSPQSRPFGLLVLRVCAKDLPDKVTILLDDWMARQPADLLYPQVAIQKILQWIWICEAPNQHMDSAASVNLLFHFKFFC